MTGCVGDAAGCVGCVGIGLLHCCAPAVIAFAAVGVDDLAASAVDAGCKAVGSGSADGGGDNTNICCGAEHGGDNIVV
jgi:hypothetical protein